MPRRSRPGIPAELKLRPTGVVHGSFECVVTGFQRPESYSIGRKVFSISVNIAPLLGNCFSIPKIAKLSAIPARRACSACFRLLEHFVDARRLVSVM